jgi:deoxycytidylate deaminase
MKNPPKLTATIYDKKGRVLSIGVNSFIKTHPRQYRAAAAAGQPLKVYLHAEIAALVRIRHGVPYRISIERYGKGGEPRLAKPCPICEIAIQQAGISRIEYTVGAD